MKARRVVLVGGSGVFGSRLARGLVTAANVEVLVAGRNLDRARTAAKETGAADGVVLDRRRATGTDIAALKPDLVIDAAGPFQGADLSFARACIAAGADYIDLADARDFVAAFPMLDAEARKAGSRAFTGASSTPALTHAVLDRLTAGWRRIDSVRAGISAGNRAPRGRSVVEAILSWTGGPVRVFEDGRWTIRPGWSGTLQHALSGIGCRPFALAETADVDLIPSRFHPREDAVFMAGLELGLMHDALGVLGWLRSRGIIPDLRPLAGGLLALAGWLSPFGSDRGGMFVEVFGRDAEDKRIRAEWTLVAPPVEGPFTPTLPALALARRLLEGESIAPGARPCVGILSLEDLALDFARHGLATNIVTECLLGPFEAALGEGFERLPNAVRDAHRNGPIARFRGTARVEGATGLARLAAALFGFPRAAETAPVEVKKQLIARGREIWFRNIGGSRFWSEIAYAGPSRVTERFGPFTFTLALSSDDKQHSMAIDGWRLGPIPLPASLAPRSTAIEAETASGAFAFDVPIHAPLLGLLVHYQGELWRDESRAEA